MGSAAPASGAVPSLPPAAPRSRASHSAAGSTRRAIGRQSSPGRTRSRSTPTGRPGCSPSRIRSPEWLTLNSGPPGQRGLPWGPHSIGTSAGASCSQAPSRHRRAARPSRKCSRSSSRPRAAWRRRSCGERLAVSWERSGGARGQRRSINSSIGAVDRTAGRGGGCSNRQKRGSSGPAAVIPASERPVGEPGSAGPSNRHTGQAGQQRWFGRCHCRGGTASGRAGSGCHGPSPAPAAETGSEA